MLESICDKFEFGRETLALGIYLYYKVRSESRWKNEEISELKQRFYTSTCLIVAGKAIELDRKVPYLNRYQRYAETSMTQDEYEREEQKVC